jgi:hypothetical protein
MNAFRDGIENAVTKHKDKTQAINQALGVKAQKVFQQGKALADAGGKLLESGVGVAGTSGPLGAGVRKGITSFNKIKAARLQKVNDVADKLKAKAAKGIDRIKSVASEVEGKARDAADRTTDQFQNVTDAVEEKVGDPRDSLPDIVGDTKSSITKFRLTATDGIEGSARQGVGGVSEAGQASGQVASRPVYDIRQLPGGRAIAGDGAEGGGVELGEGTSKLPVPGPEMSTKNTNLFPEEKGDDGPPPTQPNAGDANQPKAATVEETPDIDPVISADVPDAITNVASRTVPNVASRAVPGVLEGVAPELDEAAAATSWLSWLGVPEILAAAGAIAGVAGAVSGVVESVKGGDAEAAGLAMKTTAPAKTAQLAGSFVTPTQDSLS